MNDGTIEQHIMGHFSMVEEFINEIPSEVDEGKMDKDKDGKKVNIEEADEVYNGHQHRLTNIGFRVTLEQNVKITSRLKVGIEEPSTLEVHDFDGVIIEEWNDSPVQHQESTYLPKTGSSGIHGTEFPVTKVDQKVLTQQNVVIPNKSAKNITLQSVQQQESEEICEGDESRLRRFSISDVMSLDDDSTFTNMPTKPSVVKEASVVQTPSVSTLPVEKPKPTRLYSICDVTFMDADEDSPNAVWATEVIRKEEETRPVNTTAIPMRAAIIGGIDGITKLSVPPVLTAATAIGLR